MTYEEFRQVMIAHYRRLRDDTSRPAEEREYYRVVVARAEAELAARKRTLKKARKPESAARPRRAAKRKRAVTA